MDAQNLANVVSREVAARVSADGLLAEVIANRFAIKPMTRWQRFKRWIRGR